MNNTYGHIFVHVVNEEKAKQNTKKMKSLELPSMDPCQSGDLGNGERNDVDADLVIIEDDEKDLEHDLKLVDDMVEKNKDDRRLGRIKKVHKIGIKGKSEKGASGSKSLKPRKTKTLNKFKTLI